MEEKDFFGTGGRRKSIRYLIWGLFVSVVTCCGTIVSSVTSARVIARFGTNRTAAPMWADRQESREL
ncbi:MAG: hypothetical protein HFH91_14820 [Lachnospiraceae bacterium]|nr:hypothetical protein [Lachnospiraceae bacterium]